jgi:hypothetical protein
MNAPTSPTKLADAAPLSSFITATSTSFISSPLSSASEDETSPFPTVLIGEVFSFSVSFGSSEDDTLPLSTVSVSPVAQAGGALKTLISPVIQSRVKRARCAWVLIYQWNGKEIRRTRFIEDEINIHIKLLIVYNAHHSRLTGSPSRRR